MSLIVVVLGVLFLVGARWSRIVLADEERYLRAVAPLAGSQMFAHVAGAVVSMAVRHKAKRHRALPPRVAKTVGLGTKWVMGTRMFGPSWMACHRMLHRHRNPRWRVSALMVILAMMGSLVCATSKAVGPAVVGVRRAVGTR